MIRCILLAVLFFAAGLGTTQARAGNFQLDANTRKETVEAVVRRMNESYVFPEVAKNIEQALRDALKRGDYDKITDGNEFAARLTRDIRAVCHDKHVNVRFSPFPIPAEPAAPLEPSPERMEQARREMARDNFGFAKVEILRGNIGYIKLNYFAPPEFAAENYIAAMNFVSKTDALIFDLRENSGSLSPDAIPMLMTFLFERPVHLNDIYWRPTGETRQFWSWAYVPGQRYLNKPVTVLTSGGTFSGAEEFAYDLQNLKRATIVGDTTGGGANPGGMMRLTDHFGMFVPVGRAINPITKTNWEGVGVKPDVAVPAGKALFVAHRDIARRLMAVNPDPLSQAAYRQAIEEGERELTRFKSVTFELAGFENAREVTVAGSFSGWSQRKLTRSGNRWVGQVEAVPGRHAYKFVVDGNWITDPANPETERQGPHLNSVRIID